MCMKFKVKNNESPSAPCVSPVDKLPQESFTSTTGHNEDTVDVTQVNLFGMTS